MPPAVQEPSLSHAYPDQSEPPRVAPRAESIDRDPLAVVDAVARVLASSEASDPDAARREALRVIAEAHDAVVAAVVRFDRDGGAVVATWDAGRFDVDPALRIERDLMHAGSQFLSGRRAAVLAPDMVGPGLSALVGEFAPGHALLLTPIVDRDVVRGAVAVIAAGLDALDERDRIAVQVAGELLWRHVRDQESRRELRERAEGAEILARIGGRLHQVGVARARALLDEVFETVGRHAEADLVVAYERDGVDLVPVVRWTLEGTPGVEPRVRLTAAQWALLAAGRVDAFHGASPSPLADALACGRPAGLLLTGVTRDGRDAALVVGRCDDRPLRPAHIELLPRIVQLLGQFRARMRAELDLIRRRGVEQMRSDIAESFLNASADEIDTAVARALARIGGVCGAERVRWFEVDPAAGEGSLVSEWSAGARPDVPTTWSIDPAILQRGVRHREPFVLGRAAIRDLTGMEATTPTLVVPAVIGDVVRSALVVSGDRFRSPVPDDERRALVDVAGLVHQARRRAHQELESAHRKTLDELQLRLAVRFLDRGVYDPDTVLHGILGEIGAALGADVLAFASYTGSAAGDLHWWHRDDRRVEASGLARREGGIVAQHFRNILDTSEPTVTRSRLLPDSIRDRVEQLAGGEFSMLVAPLRAGGIVLMLGIAVLRDREWSPAETSMLQQTIGQLRQFVEVLASRGQLEHDAAHDSLTGLANRRRINEEFARLVEAGRPGSVLMIDVDRFKAVNDSLGHSAGDAVLVSIADRIRMSVRDGDLVARLGGDEFAIVMDESATRLELAAAAQRLISVVREPVVVRGTPVVPTCSIGIATAGPGDDVDAVMRHADAAMYNAKSKGRDRYEFFDDAHRQSLRARFEMETGLRRAVTAGEFVPWFQPEYDLATDRIIGVEALIRWNHPTDGVLDASAFIDVAEEIGLAPELSRMVIQRSFETLRGWLGEGFETRMRVNVATAQLQSHELADQISDALDRLGIPPTLLCVEVTERSLMLDPAGAAEALGRVRALGVEVAVDDFGTGFSSLARLKELPVDTLKIDRSFVAGIVANATDREIVRTIVWLSRGLGLDVVAEGVENRAQGDLLLELGCRRAQGWLWSPAVPADEVPRLARSGARPQP